MSFRLHPVLLFALVPLVACAAQESASPPPMTTGGSGGSGGNATGGTASGGSAGAGGRGGAPVTPPGTGGSNSPAGSGGAPDASAPANDVAVPDPDVGPASGDSLPERPLMPDKANPQLFTFKFKPSEADPAAQRRDEVQTAVVDTRVPLRGKLVVALSGVNNPPGPVAITGFAAALGFHTYAIAYENSINPSGQNDPKFFGDMRFEQFDGMDRTGAITVSRADSVEGRVAKALAYLQGKNAAGDWAYFLDKSGGVRWSDVIFIGHSHGASSAAAYAKIRRVWRAISLAGPRDTRPVEAAWLTMPSATPIERYYALTGTGDGQHEDHLKAMEAMKYIGAVVDVGATAPPFQDSHRLKYNGGHGDPAGCNGNFAAVCKYMLGVP